MIWKAADNTKLNVGEGKQIEAEKINVEINWNVSISKQFIFTWMQLKLMDSLINVNCDVMSQQNNKSVSVENNGNLCWVTKESLS